MFHRQRTLCVAILIFCGALGASAQENASVVQAQVILTVSEGKRLIAKAVTQMPAVRKALAEGVVVVARGTTNTYVAEELTGQKIAHGSYVIGWTGPAKGGKTFAPKEKPAEAAPPKDNAQSGSAIPDALKELKPGEIAATLRKDLAQYQPGQTSPNVGATPPSGDSKPVAPNDKTEDIVLVNGKVQPGMTLDEALKNLKSGDVVIKGANALDPSHKLAGILIGGGPTSTAGTTGKMMSVIVGRKAHLVIPVGLEKQVAGSVADIATMMREPIESLNEIPSMFLVNGEIMTEIEALELLAGVKVFQAAAGGIGGAEGASRLICRGTREEVQKALEIAESVQGEPPFIE